MRYGLWLHRVDEGGTGCRIRERGERNHSQNPIRPGKPHTTGHHERHPFTILTYLCAFQLLSTGPMMFSLKGNTSVFNGSL